MSSGRLAGFRVAALIEDRFEEAEYVHPRQALTDAGAEVALISALPEIQALRHFDAGERFARDLSWEEAPPEAFDALLLPGGVINADALRLRPEAQRMAQALVRAGKPVAVICHGGWLLISSGLVQGRTVTSWPSLQDDFRNAGAHWVDQEVVVDGNWISSRKPDDLPAFNRETIRIFADAARQKSEREPSAA